MLKIFAIFSKSLAKLITFTLRKKHLWKFPIFLGGKNTDICPTEKNCHAHCPIFKKLADMVIILKMTIKANVATK